MRGLSRSLLARYGVAVLGIALATGLRLLLNPILGSYFPFATLFFAVLVAAWYGGFGPAVAAMLLGAGASVALLLPARQAEADRSLENQAGMVLYLTVSLGIAGLGGMMRRARDDARASAVEAVQQREECRTILTSIGDGVIVTDNAGLVVSLNPVAESLVGWTSAEAVGLPLETVFRIHEERSRRPVESPVARVLQEGTVVGLANHTVLLARDGTERPIDDSAAPIRDGTGHLTGVVLVFRDVTERRRTEEAVQERARQLQLITDNAPVLIAHCDSEQRFKFVNKPYASRFGLSPGDVVGKTIAEVLGPEVYAVIRPYVDAVHSGRRVEFEVEVPYRDLGKRQMHCAYEPEFDDEGRVVGYVAAIINVTERKRIEIALRESEERFRQLAENVEDVFYVSAVLPLQVLYVSPAYERTWGRTCQSLYDQPLSFLKSVLAEDRERVAAALQKQLRGQATAEEYRIRRPDGTVSWVWDRAFPVRDSSGAVIRVVGIVEDVTERKRSEQLLGFLANASAALAALVDCESTLQKVARLAVPFFADWCSVDVLEENGSLRRLAVAHVDPAKLELAHEMHRKYPPDPRGLQGAWNIVRTGRSEIVPDISDELLQATVQDPERLRLLRELELKSYIGVPLLTRGKVLGVVTFISAESGHRYDANDLSVAEDLAHRAAVALENSRLYQEVRDADRRKDEFLALLAHELRNPLAPIRNALTILGLRGGEPETLDRAREMMERQLQHLVRLVDDLLDVSRIMRGKVELRKERLAIGTAVTRAVETAQPVIAAKGHELLIALPPDPIEVEADPIRLSQVIGNLLTNAAKYTEQAGRIWLTVERESGEAAVRVKDSGIGITPEMLAKVFDLFVQVESAADRSQGGLGIGLTLAKNLVEMHGGRIEAHSAGAGQGSEFVVRLPLWKDKGERRKDQSAEAALFHPSSLIPHPSEKRRVLVVDDNTDAANSLALLLRLQGHEVWVAHDGHAALEAAQSHSPDVVFLDIGMPHMDGIEVARRMKQQSGSRTGLLVALTGWGQEEDRRRTREAGFDHHLVKPVEPTILSELLARSRP